MKLIKNNDILVGTQCVFLLILTRVLLNLCKQYVAKNLLSTLWAPYGHPMGTLEDPGSCTQSTHSADFELDCLQNHTVSIPNYFLKKRTSKDRG